MVASSGGPEPLAPDAIELINAYGPYSHGNWLGRDVIVGNEEALAGRGEYIVQLIRQAILKRWSEKEIEDLSLVDVGCYDGWITCRLASLLPLKRIVGVEPREKNLRKGAHVRSTLGIASRCEFVQGDVDHLNETLNGEKFDIVVCVGLLYHLPSISSGIESLYRVCKQLLFVETICLPASFEDERARRALELKDLPYLYREPIFGISGHKLESGYYDGSATKLSVVSIPSPHAVKMMLEVQGFCNVGQIVEVEGYSSATGKDWRSFSAACFTAEVLDGHDPSAEVKNWIEDYEGGLIRTVLPEAVADTLYRRLVDSHHPAARSWAAMLAARATTSQGQFRSIWMRLLRAALPDRHAFEIVKNVRFAPEDKIRLERGKLLMARGDPDRAEEVLKGITCRLNADWRSVYRAFCLLAWISRERGDRAAAARYEELCLLANPQFPASVLADSTASFRAL